MQALSSQVIIQIMLNKPVSEGSNHIVKLFFPDSFYTRITWKSSLGAPAQSFLLEGFEKNSKDRHSLTLHPGQAAAGVWGGDLQAWHSTGLNSQRLGPKSCHVGNPCPLPHALILRATRWIFLSSFEIQTSGFCREDHVLLLSMRETRIRDCQTRAPAKEPGKDWD